MSREDALAMVRPEEGLDLIEISPTASPPVVRLMSFDKYRYLKEKAEKKERVSQKKTGLKQIQISARAAAHDLQVKLKKLEEFLAEDHPVEIQMRLRGREKGNKDWAFQKLDEFMKMITIEYKASSAPKFGGRGIYVQITKKK
jgi:translation initiation factor IF-3